jgi:redox-sensitive bicupin YhaK (pirin superfamily)
MNTIIHKAETRGKADFGWLKSFHTFSFGSYHNLERIHFGALRVLNDDTVSAAMGFGTHPHEDMEIISIPLEGDLEHKDSMGNVAVIKQGDIQVLSAGTGIYHSEYNRNKDRQTKFLQIWIFPNKKGVTPRYDQKTLNLADRQNKLQLILAGEPSADTVWIHQDARFYLGKFDNNINVQHALKSQQHGVYAFILSGDWNINGNILASRDGIGISQTSEISVTALSDQAEILLMEVPMQA